MKTVKRLHKEAKPEDKDYMYPQKLYEFWATLPEARKKDHGVEMDSKTAHQMFHRYYNTRLKCLWEHCCKQKGAKTNEWKVVFEHWKNIYPEVEKKDKDLQFESEANAKAMIETWMNLLVKEERDRREQWKAEQVKAQAEFAQKEEQRKKKLEEKLKVSGGAGEVQATDAKGNPLSEKAKRKQLQKQAMSKLAVPKDRLVRGKTVVELQTKFPDDKILRQMLVSEFANDKLVKRPLEYDYVDSEEEDRIKMRENKAKGKRSKSEGKEDKPKEKGSWVTLEAKEAKRAKELMQRFNELSKKYNKEKETLMLQDRDYENKLKNEKKQFEEFLAKAAAKYRRNILAKNNEEVPSENQFLSDVGLPHVALQGGAVEVHELRRARVQALEARREQAAQREELPAHVQARVL